MSQLFGFINPPSQSLNWVQELKDSPRRAINSPLHRSHKQSERGSTCADASRRIRGPTGQREPSQRPAAARHNHCGCRVGPEERSDSKEKKIGSRGRTKASGPTKETPVCHVDTKTKGKNLSEGGDLSLAALTLTVGPAVNPLRQCTNPRGLQPVFFFGRKRDLRNKTNGMTSDLERIL